MPKHVDHVRVAELLAAAGNIEIRGFEAGGLEEDRTRREATSLRRYALGLVRGMRVQIPVDLVDLPDVPPLKHRTPIGDAS